MSDVNKKILKDKIRETYQSISDERVVVVKNPTSGNVVVNLYGVSGDVVGDLENIGYERMGKENDENDVIVMHKENEGMGDWNMDEEIEKVKDVLSDIDVRVRTAMGGI